MAKCTWSVLLLLPLLIAGGCRDDRPETEGTGSGVREEAVKQAVGVSSGGPSEAMTAAGLEVYIVPEEPGVEDGLRVVSRGVAAAGYSWWVGGVVLDGERGATLAPYNFAKGQEVSVIVESVDGQQQSAAVTIRNTPPEVVSVGLETDALHAGVDAVVLPQAEDVDGDEVQFAYQWLVNGEESLLADGPLLPGDAYGKGDELVVRITPFDGEDDGPVFQGEPLIVPSAPPRIASQPPMGFEGRTYDYQVQAEDPDQETLTYILEAGPEGMVIAPHSGALNWAVPADGAGEHAVRIVVQDEEGMTATQEYTLRISIAE